jgi:hypothetical protein
MNDGPKVRRVLHMKFTFPSANPKELLSLIEAGKPFMEFFGGKTVQLLQNADDPARFIQVIEYEAAEEIEKSRQKLASDARFQTFLQTWRSMLPGGVELDIFQDVAHL